MSKQARTATRARAMILIGAATLIVACGGGGGIGAPPPSGPPPPAAPQLPNPASAPAMKTVSASNYLVGAAIPPDFTTGANGALLLKHMSSLTAENAMKPDTIQPSLPGSPDQPAALNFVPADTIVNFALANNIEVRGHTLLWHVTAPSWFFAGCNADPAGCLPNVRLKLRNYIHAVVTHFGGNIYAWDVVNEVVANIANPSNPYRTDSIWYTTYLNAKNAGANVEPWDYIEDAFRYAAEARTSLGLNSADMKLMINDFLTEAPGKRDNLIRVITDLRNKGVPLDGVGHQFHLRLDASVTDVTAALTAIEAFDGLVNHVTELDVNLYADPVTCQPPANPPTGCIGNYGATPPQAILSQQATLYRALYNAFKRPSVTSVTTWGLHDGHSWLNDPQFPRTNHPLLFDFSGNPKWAFWTVVDSSIVVP
jgi:endo-1,4-beta-xylanase